MDREALEAKVMQIDPSITAQGAQTNVPAVVVPVGKMRDVMRQLREDPELQFAMLLDHAAIDWLKDGNFELVYQLYSFRLKAYLTISVIVPRDNPTVPTVRELWPVAEWQEREVYDLFGILYEDHPDLRRLFLEDDWEGFPLRKDYEDDYMLDAPK